jgi:hypothetical protein
VRPGAAVQVEVVERQEAVALFGDERDGVADVVRLDVVHHVVQADPAPAGLDAAEALVDPLAVLLRLVVADAQQAMAVGSGAGAAGPRLDAEQVVQQRGDELRMQVAPARALQVERDDADAPCGVGVAEDLDARVLAPAVEGAVQQFALAALDGLDADGVLDLEGQPGLEDLQHAGRAGLFALLDVGDEVLAVRADVVDRAAGADAGRQLGVVDAPVEHQHAGGARPAEELVRRDEHRVQRSIARYFPAPGSCRSRRTARWPRSRNRRWRRARAAGPRSRAPA